MKKLVYFFDKKIQMCILKSPLGRLFLISYRLMFDQTSFKMVRENWSILKAV